MKIVKSSIIKNAGPKSIRVNENEKYLSFGKSFNGLVLLENVKVYLTTDEPIKMTKFINPKY